MSEARERFFQEHETERADPVKSEPTPRTDAEQVIVPLASSAGEGHRLWVSADFARTLERELAEAQIKLTAWDAYSNDLTDANARAEALEASLAATKEQLLAQTPQTDLAREDVAFAWKNGGYQAYSEEQWLEQLEALERKYLAAKSALAAERERCALICEQHRGESRIVAGHSSGVEREYFEGRANGANCCAAAIRASSALPAPATKNETQQTKKPSLDDGWNDL